MVGIQSYFSADKMKKVRKGARKIVDIPEETLILLAEGEIESANLMEWLATDMSALALKLASEASSHAMCKALEQASLEMSDASITKRLHIAGRALASVTSSFDDATFKLLAMHRSDLVRQWACYAVNCDSYTHLSPFPTALEERLHRTLPFAADSNMTVREAAWMAFRPAVQRNLMHSLNLLEPLSRDSDANIRRFTIEVTRPRSVWGAHIQQLKLEPSVAMHLLNNVKEDASRYVQLAVGNWLNDASKSRPDWVLATCSLWSLGGHPHTERIIKRGLRTIERLDKKPKKLAMSPGNPIQMERKHA